MPEYYGPTLDGFVKAIDKNQGVLLSDIGEGKTLIVKTKNSTYTIQVVNPATQEVIVSGGLFFVNPTGCILSGATLGSSFLKIGWIGIGMSMEFHKKEHGTVVTSFVQSISLIGPSSKMVH